MHPYQQIYGIHIYVLTMTFNLMGHMALFTQYLKTLYFHSTDLAAIWDFCYLRKMQQWEFLGTLFRCTVDCGKQIILQFCHYFVIKSSDRLDYKDYLIDTVTYNKL